MRRMNLGLAALTLVVLGVGPARGELTFYPTRAAFDAATTGVTTIDFEGIAPAHGFSYFGRPGSLTLSGVTFTTPSNTDLYVISSTFYPYDLGSGDFLLAGNGVPSALTAQLPGAFTAVAFELGTFDQFNSQVTITLSTGDVFTASAPISTHTFVGLTSTLPVASVNMVITGGDRRDALAVDDFSFGAAVPEPGTLTLFVIGTLSLIGYSMAFFYLHQPVAQFRQHFADENFVLPDAAASLGDRRDVTFAEEPQGASCGCGKGFDKLLSGGISHKRCLLKAAAPSNPSTLPRLNGRRS
jgi:hypothetical protein